VAGIGMLEGVFVATGFSLKIFRRKTSGMNEKTKFFEYKVDLKDTVL
jgi:hypothetical protein